MAVAGELSVLRERLDTIERLARAKGLLSLDEIEGYRPDEQVSAEVREASSRLCSKFTPYPDLG